MSKLYQKLLHYSESDYYGFHMPGHKRNIGKMDFVNPYQIDITEIDNFDNLHHARGIIKESEICAGKLYGSEETKFLINGSTAGLLSAISGTVGRGGCLIAARNCHKSVYHGIFLNNIDAQYVYPSYIESYGINGGISPEQIEVKLKENKQVQAVLITSPTYDGCDSDVKAIADICHKYSVPLIVDQAHGAHYGFHEELPQSAVKQGADIVIHSLHKTMPSMTQTAIIHLNGELIDKARIEKYLAMYQSSSPSYVLMASIDACIRLIDKEGKELFSEYIRNLKRFREACRSFKHIRLAETFSMEKDMVKSFDISKLLFSVKGTSMKGVQLYEKLLRSYHLQMEMAADDYVLGMTSILDEQRGFERLLYALSEIDMSIDFDIKKEKTVRIPKTHKTVLKISDAENAEKIAVNLSNSEGEISAEYVYLYPPGIPLLVPGEEISAELLELFDYYKSSGLELDGLKNQDKIEIVDKRCG